MKSNLSIFALSISYVVKGEVNGEERGENLCCVKTLTETGERKIEKEEITKRRDRKDVKIKEFVEGLGFSKFENRR